MWLDKVLEDSKHSSQSNGSGDVTGGAKAGDYSQQTPLYGKVIASTRVTPEHHFQDVRYIIQSFCDHWMVS